MSKKSVWELLERVAPVYLNSYRDNEFLVIRVLYNKVDKKNYLDIRIFEKKGDTLSKTDKGIYIPIENWSEHLNVINNLWEKYK